MEAAHRRCAGLAAVLLVSVAAAEDPEPYRVHSIRLEGNEKTRDEVLLRESLLQPGDVFRLSLASRTRDRLLKLGIFQDVSVRPERPGGEGAGHIDLDIQVVEVGRGLWYGGGSFSGSEGLIGTLDAQIPNLGGRAYRLNTSLDLGTRRRRLAAGFASPWTFGRRIATSVAAMTLSQDYPGRYRRRSEELHLRLGPWEGPMSPWMGLLLQRDRYPEIPVQADASLYPNGSVSAIQLGVRYAVAAQKRPDSEAEYLVEIGMPGPFSDLSYLRHEMDFRFHRDAPGGALFSLSARAALIEGGSTRDNERLGPWRRYTPGGIDWFDGQVRGYPDRSLGPRVDGRVTGGRALAVANLELRRSLRDHSWVFLFFDLGEAWESAGAVDLAELKRSAGAGVVLEVPSLRGPVSLALGYGLDRREVDGQPPAWRLQLQVVPRIY